MTKNTKRPPAGLPDKDTLLAFLRDAGTAEKADIARHFGLKGHERRMLREMIRALEEEGKLGKRGRKGFSEVGALPPVGVADVVCERLERYFREHGLTHHVSFFIEETASLSRHARSKKLRQITSRVPRPSAAATLVPAAQRRSGKHP